MLFFCFIFDLIKAFTIYTDDSTLAYKRLRVYLADESEDGLGLSLLS